MMMDRGYLDDKRLYLFHQARPGERIPRPGSLGRGVKAVMGAALA